MYRNRFKRLLGTRVFLALTVTAILILSGVVPALADLAGGCDFSPANNGTPGCLPSLSGSTFAGGDGNLLTSPTSFGTTDWQNVAGLNVGFDLASGKPDNSFGQGTKEDDPNVSVVTGSIPPNKSDLTRFYEASEQAASGNIFLYLGWERTNVLGTANFDFEINQKAQPDLTTTGAKTLNRTAGDLLVTYDFTNGGGRPTIGLLRWLTSATVPVVPNFSTNACFSSNTFPCWGDEVTLDGTDSIAAVNNLDPVTDPLFSNGANYINPVPALQFGETAINLTQAGVFQPGICTAFGSTFVRSRSSASFTAEVKDFIAPVPVSISNCGTIIIRKVTENGDNTFNYSTTGGLSPSTFPLSNGGSQTYNSVPSGSYSVTEGSLPSGWTFKNLSCTVTGSGTSASTSGTTVNITMGLGGSVDCTYTNHTNLSPTISTILSATSITVGGSVYDTATLSGATSNASGTVTYTVYTDSACSQGAQSAGTKTVTNGAVPNSDSITFNSTGDFYWQAVYSGDGNNNAATSACTDEHLVVNKAKPSNSTAQTLLPNDSFTLSGGVSPTGTITFNLYSPSDATCSGAPAYSETVNVNGNGTYSTSNSTVYASTVGTWRWLDIYSGDASNESTTSACGTERFTIANQ